MGYSHFYTRNLESHHVMHIFIMQSLFVSHYITMASRKVHGTKHEHIISMLVFWGVIWQEVKHQVMQNIVIKKKKKKKKKKKV
jgi:hypothetical protein